MTPRSPLANERLRDPFIFSDTTTGRYFLTGTNPGVTAFPLWQSMDFVHWQRLPDAFSRTDGFWADREYWAPEIHEWRGSYYLFATFKAEGKFRATQILASPQPEGPYTPLTAGPITPSGWECLDGTLYRHESGPWLVFCREWVQTHDGGMWAMPLTDDLKGAAGRPVWLFDASEAPWVKPMDLSHSKWECRFPCYVTDGPWIHRTARGELLMLWSSFGGQGYTLGVARSKSGEIVGPWTHDEAPLWKNDGGHAMIFQDREGRSFLLLHAPNKGPDERTRVLPLNETAQGLSVITQPSAL